MDLLDTHLDLLDTDITGDYFYLQGVLKASSRYVFGASSGRLGGRGVVALGACWGRLRGMSWGRLGGVLGAGGCLLGAHSVFAWRCNGDFLVLFFFKGICRTHLLFLLLLIYS